MTLEIHLMRLIRVRRAHPLLVVETFLREQEQIFEIEKRPFLQS
jgi:hypothetical protein